MRPLHWIALAVGCLLLGWSWSWPSPQIVVALPGAAAVVAAWVGLFRVIRIQRRFSVPVGLFTALTLALFISLCLLLPLRLRVAIDQGPLSRFGEIVSAAQGVEVPGSCFRLVAEPGGARWVVGVGHVAVGRADLA